MFLLDKTYEKLTTQVFGGIGIVRVPFREVHGMDACKDIKRKSDGKKVYIFFKFYSYFYCFYLRNFTNF